MRFELLIALTVMNIIIWDVTPCSLIDTGQHFGEFSCLHLLPSVWKW